MSVFVLGLLLAFTGCDKSGQPEAAKQRYHCPMHPTYVSDRPGDCPICNMKLVPIRDDKAPSRSDTSAANGARKHEGHTMDGDTASEGVPGRVSVHVSPEKRQLIGVTLAKVERRNLTREVRTVGIVQHDETRYRRIAPRFAGWVGKLHVNFTGAPVQQGETLFTVYSPELFSTENEYLIAWRSLRQLGGNASPNQRESAEALLDSARLRLSLFEIGDEEVRQLEQRGRASAELPFRAPISGHVLVKNAVEGKAFTAGESLYEIADLSHLWIQAFVYEYEMGLIRVGQEGKVEFPYLDGQVFSAKVTFMDPHIEPQSRRAEVRLELDNPGHRLRLDMWANVTLEVDSGEKLTVPASAVIDTGQRYVAFTAEDDDLLVPREVKVGMRTDDYYEVLSGLDEGQQVVRRALFLVDSESQLKAAISDMSSSGGHSH